MEAGKLWLIPVLLTLTLTGLSANRILYDMHEASVSTKDGELLNGKYYGVSLDLSTCHPSYSFANRSLHCCPAKAYNEQPVDFELPDPSLPMRVRRPAHLADDNYYAKYEKAIRMMQNLPPDHPHNFWGQSKLHCTLCTGAYDQANSTLPYNIHRTWLFYPWHRAFLYFHERILGKFIGDDTFALPFWNWDSPPGMKIPDLYMKGSLHNMDRDSSHLLPRIADLSYPNAERGLGDEDQIASNLAFMYQQMISSATKPELFIGCRLRPGENGACDGPGTIEVAPHNTVHRWVGSELNPEREDMGAFYSAARDPMFYAHHANMDRLWTVWKKLHGIDLEFADSDWLDASFYFYDENVRLVRVKVRDCLDTTNFRYKYEDVDLPWVDARPKPSVPPKIAREILKTRDNYNGLRLPSDTDKSQKFGLEGEVLDKIIRAQVLRPKRLRTKKEIKEEEEVLVVFGIDVKKDMFVKFDVFINAVNETATSSMSREFAGTFVHMRHGVKRVKSKGEEHVMVKTKGSLKLGISELLKDLEADEDESIWVSLVPIGGTGVNTTIGGIRIEYMR